jgi:hypothetical protein
MVFEFSKFSSDEMSSLPIPVPFYRRLYSALFRSYKFVQTGHEIFVTEPFNLFFGSAAFLYEIGKFSNTIFF